LKWPKEKLPHRKKTKNQSVKRFHYLERENLGELLAKCAAEDGFSIHAIAKSFAIR
jgi:hypothetical protein